MSAQIVASNIAAVLAFNAISLENGLGALSTVNDEQVSISTLTKAIVQVCSVTEDDVKAFVTFLDPSMSGVVTKEKWVQVMTELVKEEDVQVLLATHQAKPSAWVIANIAALVQQNGLSDEDSFRIFRDDSVSCDLFAHTLSNYLPKIRVDQLEKAFYVMMEEGLRAKKKRMGAENWKKYVEQHHEHLEAMMDFEIWQHCLQQVTEREIVDALKDLSTSVGAGKKSNEDLHKDGYEEFPPLATNDDNLRRRNNKISHLQDADDVESGNRKGDDDDDDDNSSSDEKNSDDDDDDAVVDHRSDGMPPPSSKPASAFAMQTFASSRAGPGGLQSLLGLKSSNDNSSETTTSTTSTTTNATSASTGVAAEIATAMEDGSIPAYINPQLLAAACENEEEMKNLRAADVVARIAALCEYNQMPREDVFSALSDDEQKIPRTTFIQEIGAAVGASEFDAALAFNWLDTDKSGYLDFAEWNQGLQDVPESYVSSIVDFAQQVKSSEQQGGGGGDAAAAKSFYGKSLISNRFPVWTEKDEEEWNHRKFVGTSGINYLAAEIALSGISIQAAFKWVDRKGEGLVNLEEFVDNLDDFDFDEETAVSVFQTMDTTDSGVVDLKKWSVALGGADIDRVGQIVQLHRKLKGEGGAGGSVYENMKNAVVNQFWGNIRWWLGYQA